ncbi:MAG: sulfite exporter TauE/SafE family protein, partial [Vulcanimicrobiaceae bacterium]
MLDYLHYLIDFGVGAGAGLLGGFFGISGGSIAIPAMSFLGHTQQTAQGTSLVMQLPNLAIGAWQYTKRGNLDVRKALVLSVSALPFTYAGALVATHMPSQELRAAFGCFMILVGSFTMWNAIKTPKQIAMLPMTWPYLSVLGACGG